MAGTITALLRSFNGSVITRLPVLWASLNATHQAIHSFSKASFAAESFCMSITKRISRLKSYRLTLPTTNFAYSVRAASTSGWRFPRTSRGNAHCERPIADRHVQNAQPSGNCAIVSTPSQKPVVRMTLLNPSSRFPRSATPP